MELFKNKKSVWRGIILGTNTRFGRSFKLENYLDGLSDVIIDASLQLVKNDGFRNALK